MEARRDGLTTLTLDAVEMTIDGGHTVIVQADKAPIVDGKPEARMRVGCGSATVGIFARQWLGHVDEGFNNAMSAIVDSNVTTALTALVLYLVGTEAVQGFAITLLVGLLASMISAVFITRTFFMLWLERRSAPQCCATGRWVQERHVQRLGGRSAP